MDACREAIRPIAEAYPDFSGAVICANVQVCRLCVQSSVCVHAPVPCTLVWCVHLQRAVRRPADFLLFPNRWQLPPQFTASSPLLCFLLVANPAASITQFTPCSLPVYLHAQGEIGAAGHNVAGGFPLSYRSPTTGKTVTIHV